METKKDPNSNRVIDLLKNKTILVTLYNTLLTFRDTDKEIEKQGDLLKRKTNKNYKVDLDSFPDEILMYEIAKEMYFDERAPGNQSIRDKPPIRLLKSPSIMVSASGVFSV